MPSSSHKGEGVGSPVQTERHTYYGWGRWWVSKAEFEKYRIDQTNKKRARKAGFDYTQVDDFLRTDQAVRHATTQDVRKNKENAAELRRLKEKFGLPPNCNRLHLAAMYNKTQDPELGKFLLKLTDNHTTDAQKLAIIRKTFMSGANPYDMLYQIALTVGIHIRKKP